MTRKIIFQHSRALGDALMFTAGFRDFKLLFPSIEICPDCNYHQFFENNPYANWDLIDQWEEQKAGKKDHGIEYYRVGYPNIQNSNNASSHFSQGFLWDMIAIANHYKPLPSLVDNSQPMTIGEFASAYANGAVGDPPLHREKSPEENRPTDSPYGEDFDYFEKLEKTYNGFCRNFARIRGDIHLSENEKRHSLLKEAYGVDNYWVVAPGGKRDCTAKMWDWRRFQEVVDHYKGRIQFVVIGKSDHLVTKLDGVIDLTDKFNDDIRGLIPLCYHSNGGVGNVTFLLHMMGCLPNKYGDYSKPFICFVGGREPLTFTTYNQVHTLHASGIYSCCATGGCWASRVKPLMKDKKLNRNLCKKPVKIDGRYIQECSHQVTAQDFIRIFERIYAGDIYKSLSPVSRPIVSRQHFKLPAVRVKKEARKKMFCKTVGCDREVVKGAEYCAECSMIKEEVVGKAPDLEKIKAEQPKPLFEQLEEVPDFKQLAKINKKKFAEINVLASLHSEGGGEQSLLMIVDLLRSSGWKVNLIPWANVSKRLNARFDPVYIQHDFVGDINDSPRPDFEKLAERVPGDIPLLFYANDQIWDFCKYSQPLVESASQLVVCINWANGDLPRWHWLSKSGKLTAVIFHCEEKRQEFDRDVFGFEDTHRVVLYGAIDIQKFLEIQPLPREDKAPLKVLKHCVADARKYVTTETQPGGDKKHVWQDHFWKDTDMDLYSKLLKKFGEKIVFEFMAAPEEVIKYFKDEKCMVFHKWNAMPVEDFLARGHVYFYRTSNHWRDNYPRVVAEALAAGLPVIGEPRDGTKDRIQHGDTGFYACHYDEVELHLGTLLRKEGLRQAMGMEAKRWAERNLDPAAWVSVLEELLL